MSLVDVERAFPFSRHLTLHFPIIDEHVTCRESPRYSGNICMPYELDFSDNDERDDNNIRPSRSTPSYVR